MPLVSSSLLELLSMALLPRLQQISWSYLQHGETWQQVHASFAVGHKQPCM